MINFRGIQMIYTCMQFAISLLLLQHMLHVKAIRYDWKMSNFGQLSCTTGENVHSMRFMAPSSHGEISFIGKVYLCNKGKSDYISVYLSVSNIPDGVNSVTVAYKFSIINSNGGSYAKYNVVVRDMSTKGPSHGYFKYIEREEARQYMDIDGSVTFRYSVICLDGTPLLPESSISVVSNDTVIWSIQNFNDLVEVASTNEMMEFYQYQSNSFHLANNEWCLLLYPKGKNQLALEHVSLYLRLKEDFPRSKPITAVVTFSIINFNGIKSNINKFNYTFQSIHDWRGNDLFLLQQDIYDPHRRILTEDNTLKVSVTVNNANLAMAVPTLISEHSTTNIAKPTITLPSHTVANQPQSQIRAETGPVYKQQPPTGVKPASVNLFCGQSTVNNGRAFFGGWPYISGKRSKRHIAPTTDSVARGEYPYQASLRIRGRPWDGKSYRRCGAAILSEYWLLTAAHCFMGVQEYIIRVGDYDDSVYEATEHEFDIDHYIPHPSYDAEVLSSPGDIALIKLKPTNGKGIIFNVDAQPFCLPADSLSDLPNTYCVISGWGDMLSPRSQQDHNLLRAAIQSMKPAECNELFNLHLSESMFCGISLGDDMNNSCYGDSGDPLAGEIDGRYVLLGITTRGSGRNCGSVNRPGVYTSIVMYKDWIKSVMTKDPAN